MTIPENIQDRPEALTPKAIVMDLGASMIFLLGSALLDYLKRLLSMERSLPGAILLLSELALLLFAIGYVIRAATYLWQQFSFLVEYVAASPTWTKVKRAAKGVLALATAILRAIRAVVIFAIAVVIFMVADVWAANEFPALASFFEKLLSSLNYHEFTASGAPQFPSPLETKAIFGFVIGCVLLAGMFRSMSYIVQRRWLSYSIQSRVPQG